jgi:O-antigen/teichoic acid export membrane protein
MVAFAPQRASAVREIGAAVRHGAVYSIGNILAKMMGFLMLPLYTHYLVPADYGLLELVELSISVLGMVLQMGIAPALLRCYAAASSQEEKNKAVSTVFLFVAATGVAVYVCGIALVRPVSALILGPAVPSKYLLLSFSSFVLSYIAGPLRIYLRALEASGKLVLLDTASTAMVLLLNITFIAGLKLGLIGVLLSPILVNIAWIVLAVATLSRIGLCFSKRLLRGMMQFGLPLILSNLAAFSLNFGDRFYLQHYRSLTEVGLYALGYKFGFMINVLLVQPFVFMWQSRMYAIHANPEYRSIFRQIFILFSMVLTYAALAMALLGRETIHLLAGPAFAGASEVIPIIALAYVVCGIGSYLQTGLYLTNRTGWIGAISGISALVSLLLYAILIRRYGMLGASWATVLSFTVLAVASEWCSRRVCPLGLDVPRVVLGVALAGAFYGAFLWWTPPNLATSVAVKLGALAAFPLVALTFRVLGPSETNLLRASLASTRASLLRRAGWKEAAHGS